MRICHLIYDDVDNPWLGGGGAHRARQIYSRLSDRHDITLVTGSFPGGESEQDVDGMRLLRIGSTNNYSLSRLSYAREAPKVLQQLEWDIWVHEFSAFAPLWISRQLRHRGVLFFQHFMGCHAIVKRPIVGLVALLAERRVLHTYPRILTVSPSVQSRIRKKVATDVSVDCVTNGVDAAYFATEPKEESFLLYLGRIDVHTKGLDLLLQAYEQIAREYPGIILKIVGGAEDRQVKRLEALVRRHGLDECVQLLGRVSDEEKRRLLASALFLCMPSRYEGWGMVAIEASASAKAVVATEIDGLRDAVKNGRTGLLVPSGDITALTAAMRRLLHDPNLRRSLGVAGRERARQYNWENLAVQQEQLLVEAAGDDRGKGV